MPKRDALLADCSLAPPLAIGRCAWCAAALPARRRIWCSDRCGESFWANHWWSAARRAVKRRDRYRCTRCGMRAPKRPTRAVGGADAAYRAAMRTWRAERRALRLEVNHREPCAGKHRQLSCAHHLANLETLCSPCHRTHTAALRETAAASGRMIA
ncbi:MAG: hypothetical protein JOZ24_00580 [Candidatus Eremiobacteraeota bacterium]|nr:hypothetical protein [Candidatus Eremiobacteraeota bacterium]